MERRWRFGESVCAVRATLERGGVVLFPTESSYAVGVDPRSAVGVEAVFRLKERERGKPLGVVLSDVDQARALGVDRDDPALLWASAYWPAPLSVLVAVARPWPAMAGADRLAVRVPDLPELRSLLREIGPLTATSANDAGAPPRLDADACAEWAAEVDHLLVDAGVLPGGAPSTVVSWEVPPGGAGRPRVIRAGRFSLPRLP